MLIFNEIAADFYSIFGLHIFFGSIVTGFRPSFGTFILKSLEIINHESVANRDPHFPEDN